LSERIIKGMRLIRESANAQISLRGCDTVGPGARLIGRPRIENEGSLVVGSGLSLNSRFMPVELMSGPDGCIELGDDVWINYGTLIAAKQRVKIGNRAQLGPHCVVSDTELPEALVRFDSLDAADSGTSEPKPIEIGDDVWLAGRVTLMPGVKIGAGTVITAGSIVTSDVPARVVAGGIPARILRSLDGEPQHHTPTKKEEAAAKAPAPAPRFFGLLVSDFTIDELADELLVPGVDPAVAAVVAPFGQVTQALLGAPHPGATDFAVVWTRPESAVSSFARAMAFEQVSEQEVIAEVDAFSAQLKHAAQGYKIVLVPTWTLPPWCRGLGMLDTRVGGVTRLLWSMNLRLADNLADVSNVFVLNAQRWFESVGRSSSSQRAWFLGKIAVPRAALREAADDIRAAIAGFGGSARKLLILDLDDTLWGGIVGDVGWESLKLGGHDSVGEGFVAFQSAVKALKQRGVILALVSKNEESVALEAIRHHPEMILREEDFVAWKINWVDKAKNILDLTTELNLGLQSVVFIDDNPVERARVREALPEVFVPEWPVDTLLYASELQRLRCFDTPALSREDLERTRLYAEERQRDQLLTQVTSLDEWLKSLQMKVRVEPLGPVNLTRATQLLNKTNQLNLSTRRLNEVELTDWARSPGRKMYTVNVSDRFGDAGLTGLVSIEVEGSEARVVDFVLSCRVMGRKVEETMAHLAVATARTAGAASLSARYLPTAKNKPCLAFWQRSGFSNQGDVEFRWEQSGLYPLPEPILLEWQK
jgi:FkbH-like protein